jgi:hypothetical protein
MGMFDAESKRLMTADEMAGAGADLLSNQLSPGIKRMTGYESPKRQAMSIANSADLSSMQSIQTAYKKIQQINPAAASAWLKDVMTSFNADTQRKATSAKGTAKIQFQKAGVPGDPTKTILLSNRSGTMQPVLNSEGQPYIESKSNTVTKPTYKKVGVPGDPTKVMLMSDASGKMMPVLGPDGKPYIENKYQVQSMQGTLPQGYRMKPDGSMEIVPGSPASTDKDALHKANLLKNEGAVRSSKLVLKTIGRLRTVISGASDNTVDNVFGITGMGGELIPNSARNNAKMLVSTIKSHIGFDRLDRMRKESPTGGALGQVSEMELKQLNATLGSLEFMQDEEQFLATLQQIQAEYQYIMDKIILTGDGTYTPSPTNTQGI